MAVIFDQLARVGPYLAVIALCLLLLLMWRGRKPGLGSLRLMVVSITGGFALAVFSAPLAASFRYTGVDERAEPVSARAFSTGALRVWLHEIRVERTGPGTFIMDVGGDPENPRTMITVASSAAPLFDLRWSTSAEDDDPIKIRIAPLAQTGGRASPVWAARVSGRYLGLPTITPGSDVPTRDGCPAARFDGTWLTDDQGRRLHAEPLPDRSGLFGMGFAPSTVLRALPPLAGPHGENGCGPSAAAYAIDAQRNLVLWTAGEAPSAGKADFGTVAVGSCSPRQTFDVVKLVPVDGEGDALARISPGRQLRMRVCRDPAGTLIAGISFASIPRFQLSSDEIELRFAGAGDSELSDPTLSTRRPVVLGLQGEAERSAGYAFPGVGSALAERVCGAFVLCRGIDPVRAPLLGFAGNAEQRVCGSLVTPVDTRAIQTPMCPAVSRTGDAGAFTAVVSVADRRGTIGFGHQAGWWLPGFALLALVISMSIGCFWTCPLLALVSNSPAYRALCAMFGLVTFMTGLGVLVSLQSAWWGNTRTPASAQALLACILLPMLVGVAAATLSARRSKANKTLLWRVVTGVGVATALAMCISASLLVLDDPLLGRRMSQIVQISVLLVAPGLMAAMIWFSPELGRAGWAALKASSARLVLLVVQARSFLRGSRTFDPPVSKGREVVVGIAAALVLAILLRVFLAVVFDAEEGIQLGNGGLRFSLTIVYLPVLVLCLAAVAHLLADPTLGLRARTVLFLTSLGAIVSPALPPISDFGAVLYGIALLVAWACLAWIRDSRAMDWVTGWLGRLGTLCVFGLFAIAALSSAAAHQVAQQSGRVGPSASPAMQVSAWALDVVAGVRLPNARLDVRREVLLDPEAAGARGDRRTEEQLGSFAETSYYAHGPLLGHGYFASAPSPGGIGRYELNDQVGVFHILHPFGRVYGWLLMVALALFGLTWFASLRACFPRGWQHPAGRPTGQAGPTLSAPIASFYLAAASAFVLAFLGIYMLATGLQVAVFTGRNIPFLSVTSGGDFIESSTMLVLALMGLLALQPATAEVQTLRSRRA